MHSYLGEKLHLFLLGLDFFLDYSHAWHTLIAVAGNLCFLHQELEALLFPK